jgi:hypothetical protein
MIKAPKWCSNAVPSRAGWLDPYTGEVLKMQNFSKEQIAEWHEAKNPTPVKKKPKVVEPAEDAPYIFEVKDSE